MTLLAFQALQRGWIIRDTAGNELAITGTRYLGNRVHAVWVYPNAKTGIKGGHYAWICDPTPYEIVRSPRGAIAKSFIEFDYDQIATEIGNADTMALMNKTLAGRA